MATERGLRPIAQIEAGERVWAYDFQEGIWRLCPVACRHDAEYDGPMVTLDLGSGEVTATAYHPFWVVQGEDLAQRSTPRHLDAYEDQGGSLSGRWVNSHDLREGDVVFLKGHGPTTVRRVVQRQERTPVCNLTIQGLHTFAVGEIQALVHNSSGTGPTEYFTDPADAIGDLNGVARQVGKGATKNQQWIDWGYTETYYFRDANGTKWTVFYNPTTRTYSGAHPSSGQ